MRNLKIMVVCPNFPPEPVAAGTMAEELAGRLTALGHTVTLLVQFPSRPKGELYPGYSRRLRAVRTSGPLRVIRCGSWLVGSKRRHWNRIMENITFGLTSALNAFREERPDLLIVETWPLIAVQMLMLVARLWKTPCVYYVQDVYPEAAEELGVIRKTGWVASLLRMWDTRLCRSCAKVVAISESMRDLICARGVGVERVAVIPNWVDSDRFPQRPRWNEWRVRIGIPESRFVAMFAGNLGLVSGADILVEVAERLQGHSDLLILCVGEGAIKGKMTGDSSRGGLTNLRFEPFQPPESLADMHGAADALLLTLRDGESDSSVPSKFISYLAAGRPVICSADRKSSVANIVRAAQVGIVTPPRDAAAIADAILQLRDDPGRAMQMGQNGRRHFEAHFTLNRALGQFTELLQELGLQS